MIRRVFIIVVLLFYNFNHRHKSLGNKFPKEHMPRFDDVLLAVFSDMTCPSNELLRAPFVLPILEL